MAPMPPAMPPDHRPLTTLPAPASMDEPTPPIMPVTLPIPPPPPAIAGPAVPPMPTANMILLRRAVEIRSAIRPLKLDRTDDTNPSKSCSPPLMKSPNASDTFVTPLSARLFMLSFQS